MPFLIASPSPTDRSRFRNHYWSFLDGRIQHGAVIRQVDQPLLRLGQRRNVGGRGDGELARVDGRGDFGNRFALDDSGTLDRTSAHVEHVGCCGLRYSANWRSIDRPTLSKICDPRRDHGPLALAQVPAVQVCRDDIADRIVARVSLEAGRDAGNPACHHAAMMSAILAATALVSGDARQRLSE